MSLVSLPGHSEPPFSYFVDWTAWMCDSWLVHSMVDVDKYLSNHCTLFSAGTFLLVRKLH
jgi:hypothetical protein